MITVARCLSNSLGHHLVKNIFLKPAARIVTSATTMSSEEKPEGSAKKQTVPQQTGSGENRGKKRYWEHQHGRARKKNKGNSNKEKVTNVQPLSTNLDRPRKVAMLLMYSGKGYHGIQRQKADIPTIERDIMQALCSLEVVPPEAEEKPQEIWFQRAARTDKGVSAVGNMLSLKMLLNVENLVEKMNEKLPSQIQVIDFIRTTKGFDCKNFCDSRTYAYLLPTYTFTPKDECVTNDYRISDETMSEVLRILQNFKGTHNFHNYTSRLKPNDPSAKRYIMSFECGTPFIQRNTEFLVLTVKGQSFILHQIRKMIGIMIAIVKGYCTEEVIEKSWGKMKVDIPKAPGLGLMLQQLHYDNYNKRYGSDGVHDPLDWSKYKDMMDKFKMERIYDEIIKTEEEEHSMIDWLETLKNHNYEEFDPDDEQQKYPNQHAKSEPSTTAVQNEASASTSDLVTEKEDIDDTHSSMDGTVIEKYENGATSNMESDSKHLENTVNTPEAAVKTESTINTPDKSAVQSNENVESKDVCMKMEEESSESGFSSHSQQKSS